MGEPDDADRLVALPGDPRRHVILAGWVPGQDTGKDRLIDRVALGADRDCASQIGLAPDAIHRERGAFGSGPCLTPHQGLGQGRWRQLGTAKPHRYLVVRLRANGHDCRHVRLADQ